MSKLIVRRVVFTAAFGVAAALAATSARAGGVHWSVGIDAPLYPGSVRTVISNAPRGGYFPPPHQFLPPQPYLPGWPRPIYYIDVPPPVVVYGPPRGYVRPGYVRDRHWHRHGHRAHWKHHRHHGDDDD